MLLVKTNSPTCALNPNPFHLLKDRLPPIHFPLLHHQFFQLYWINSSAYKHAVISPILKNAFNFILPSNYYPFFQFLSSNSLLNPLRSDFHLHHFIKATLVKVTNDLHLDDSSGHLSVPTVSDLPEAFHSLYHFFLLEILAVVGLQDSILSWSSSTSLASPSQSPLLHHPHLPHFSILEFPGNHSLGLLFSLYTHFFSDLIQPHGFKCHLHSDNSQSYTFSLDPFPEFQTHVSNFLHSRAPLRYIFDISRST